MTAVANFCENRWTYLRDKWKSSGWFGKFVVINIAIPWSFILPLVWLKLSYDIQQLLIVNAKLLGEISSHLATGAVAAAGF